MSHTTSFTTPDYSPAARIVQRGLATLSELCRWISHTGDPDLPPNSCVSGRTLRDVARSFRAHAIDLETFADRLDLPDKEGKRPGPDHPGDASHERP